MPYRFIPGCIVWLAAMLAFAASAQENAPVPSVIVAPVVAKDVTPRHGYVGRVEAVDRVELRARVEGYLEQRLFQEGHYVTQGQALFVIEKAPYEVVVAERKAELAAAKASLKNARADLARKQDLRVKKVLSQADLDTAEAAEAKASAEVLRVTAALQRAELDLGYTEVLSPIDGLVSRARYSIGNLVGPSSEPLAASTLGQGFLILGCCFSTAGTAW